MAQTDALIGVLKQALKSHRLTYADVGKALEMSEANVKRLFATNRFTLNRLEEICQIMQMELSDLFELYDNSRQRIAQLTHAQETELIRDEKLLIVAIAVRNQFSFADILSYYQLTEVECIQCLAKLDRLKIIDLLPGNRIKLRVAEDFRWLADGPIERYFESQLQSQFFASHFNGEHEQRLFLHGLLSESATQQMINKLQSLANEFTERLRQDAKLPIEQRQPIGAMLAIRPWEADLFQSYSRKSRKR